MPAPGLQGCWLRARLLCRGLGTGSSLSGQGGLGLRSDSFDLALWTDDLHLPGRFHRLVLVAGRTHLHLDALVGACSRGLAELGRLARAAGAQESTLFGLAGVGDLEAVHARPGAPYFDAGRSLADGKVVDGPWGLAEALLATGEAHGVELPLVQSLVEVVGGGDPVDAIQRLMSRRSAKEHR